MTIQADFIVVAAEVGENVSWYVNTETIDSQTGDRVNSYGSPSTIKAIVNRVSKDGKTDPEGYLEDNELVLYTDNTDALSIFDKVKVRTIDYEVKELMAEQTYAGTVVFRKWQIKRIVADGS